MMPEHSLTAAQYAAVALECRKRAAAYAADARAELALAQELENPADERLAAAYAAAESVAAARHYANLAADAAVAARAVAA